MVVPGDAFQHYFWGEKNAGFDVLLGNMKQGLTASKEFQEILKERANYEEAFSKSLKRLSDKVTTINSVGSFLPLWNVIKKYMETMSTTHSTFTDKFRELLNELNVYVDNCNKANKANRENPDMLKASHSLSVMRHAHEQVDKCKRTYQLKHKEMIESEEVVTKAVGSTTTPADAKTEKEQERNQQKYAKCQEAFVTAENNYKASVEKYNKIQGEYNDSMTLCCKFLGEVEQVHLNNMVEFAKKFGELETDLVEELKKNCEVVLGGDPDEQVKSLVGYTPEYLIELFVEEKQTGVEMAPLLKPELLTSSDLPVVPANLPKPIEKSSDSGSIHSLPNAHNSTTTTTSTDNRTMTLAMNNIKAFKKMLKKGKAKSKQKDRVENVDGDNKSLDSKNGDDNSDNVSISNASDRSRGELDFIERHGNAGKTSYFSSDDDDDIADSDNDDLTSKVKTIKIKSGEAEGGATEEELRKATESLTLKCLSPGTTRNRATTYNHHAFSGSSSDANPLSPDGQPKQFAITFDTPRAKSVSSPRISPRRNHNNQDNSGGSWAVFDESFKGGNSGSSSWATPPTKRKLFDQDKEEIANNSNNAANKVTNDNQLLDISPTAFAPTPSSLATNQNIEDLLSITNDDFRGMTPNSEYMTPDGSPIDDVAKLDEQELSVKVEQINEGEKEEGAPAIEDRGKRRLNSLIEFSPVRLGSEELTTPAADTADPLKDNSVKNTEYETESKTNETDSKPNESISITADDKNDNKKTSTPVSDEHMTVEDSKLLSVVGKAQSLEDSLSTIHSLDTHRSNGSIMTRSTPTIPTAVSPTTPPLLPNPLIPNHIDTRIITDSKASTENVMFSGDAESTSDESRKYPIAIAIIETSHACFKADKTCTSKIEGELIMSLPAGSAKDILQFASPPPLKLKISSAILPTNFIINRQIFTIKPAKFNDSYEVNMDLLQAELRKRLTTSANLCRLNLPLLKYTLPVVKNSDTAPLIIAAQWTTGEVDQTIVLDISANKTVLSERPFHFPRITLTNSFESEAAPQEFTHASPPPILSEGQLKWELFDIGNEIIEQPINLCATWETPTTESSNTKIDFELEDVVVSGTEIELSDSESYEILTTIKKVKSGKYWTEPLSTESSA